mmetsp:Transcript_13901/g.30269  ORF Transcript_13901/g.30269 Transcript_13901/m.30269 type:complete len:419 (+) Transcript_13901:132-1388(+)
MAKWTSGGNSSESLTPSDEGSRRSNFSYRDSTRGAKQHRGDKISAETCAKYIEIPHGKAWQETLQDAINDLGVTDDRCVLVTDVLGVEVPPYDRNGSRISAEQFPLRVRVVSGSLLPSSPPRKTSKNSSVRTPVELDKEAIGRQGQISLEVEYEDIWPGILKVKLGEQGVILSDDSDGLNFLVATDATGVELDLSKTRVPSPDRFPLKLHFRASRMGPQNFPCNYNSNYNSSGGNSNNNNNKDSFNNYSSSGPTLERSSSKRNSASAQADRKYDLDPGRGMFEHSMELPFSGMLSDIVNAKLVQIGICLGDASCRQLALITDCLGVIVDADGDLPDRHRFPIKVHLERSALMMLPEDDKRRVFGDNRRARRSFADLGGLDHSNSMANMGARWSSACESMLRAFVRSRAGCKDAFGVAA